MKPFRKIYIENGDMFEPYYIFTCEGCGEEIEEAWPMFDDSEGMWCGDCAFIHGKISEAEYIKSFMFFDGRVLFVKPSLYSRMVLVPGAFFWSLRCEPPSFQILAYRSNGHINTIFCLY